MFSLRKRGLRAKLAGLAPLVDWTLFPSTVVAALEMRALREFNLAKLPRCRQALETLGVFPLRAHYYEPLFERDGLRENAGRPRRLPGIELNWDLQVQTLAGLGYRDELSQFARTGARPGVYAFDCGNFGAGDSEVTYCMLRRHKPKRVFEIGSGFSTLVINAALERNRAEGHPSELCCVEPYEMAWLESLGVRVERTLVERLPASFFSQLEAGDVLFIDSSHMIRPGGDVLHLINEVLPALPRGVHVHVHDIFTPYEYPKEWLVDGVCFWNEQYLLEAFLSNNQHFRVELALHGLFRERQSSLFEHCPGLAGDSSNPPKSCWLRS
jgi:hypothetical protein